MTYPKNIKSRKRYWVCEENLVSEKALPMPKKRLVLVPLHYLGDGMKVEVKRLGSGNKWILNEVEIIRED